MLASVKRRSGETLTNAANTPLTVNRITQILLPHQVKASDEIRKVLEQFHHNWQVGLESFVVDCSYRCINELRANKVGVAAFEFFEHVDVHLSSLEWAVLVIVQVV